MLRLRFGFLLVLFAILGSCKDIPYGTKAGEIPLLRPNQTPAPEPIKLDVPQQTPVKSPKPTIELPRLDVRWNSSDYDYTTSPDDAGYAGYTYYDLLAKEPPPHLKDGYVFMHGVISNVTDKPVEFKIRRDNKDPDELPGCLLYKVKAMAWDPRGPVTPTSKWEDVCRFQEVDKKYFRSETPEPILPDDPLDLDSFQHDTDRGKPPPRPEPKEPESFAGVFTLEGYQSRPFINGKTKFSMKTFEFSSDRHVGMEIKTDGGYFTLKPGQSLLVKLYVKEAVMSIYEKEKILPQGRLPMRDECMQQSLYEICQNGKLPMYFTNQCFLRTFDGGVKKMVFGTINDLHASSNMEISILLKNGSRPETDTPMKFDLFGMPTRMVK